MVEIRENGASHGCGKKGGNLKRLNGLLFVLSSVLLVGAANAAESRVLVVMKTKASFMAVHQNFQAQGEYALKGFNFGLKSKSSSLSKVNGKVQDSLPNLNSVVLNVSNDSEVLKLKANPEVAYVEKEIMHPLPQPFRGRIKKPVDGTDASFSFSEGVKTPWGILAVKAPQAWQKTRVGAAGSGVRVMVLDTGVDKDHPALAANIEKTQDFVGDNNQPYDVADHIGHGTHVSGTILGIYNPQTGFSGVAPKAKLLMGRVCSAEGCSNISIAQGINWAISEKVDVVSMSLGGSLSTPAERDAISRADKAGITVVAASGNDGSAKVSFPAALPTVIAVGAIDSKMQKASFSQYGPQLAVVAPGVDVVSSVPVGTGREPQVKVSIDGKVQDVNSATFEGARDVETPEENFLVNAGLGKDTDFTGINVQGKFALVQRGEIKFMDKINNAMKAGAVGIIVYNNAPGLIHGALTQDGSKLNIAVFMVEQTVGEQLKANLAAGKVVKAQIATVATDYSSFDGTSMATPHVAGVVALIKGANKALSPAQVKSILQSTAVALTPNDQNQLGAGLVDAEKAVATAITTKAAMP